MSESNTLLYYITRSTDFLNRKGVRSPRLEAEVLLSHVLKIPRIQLYTQFDMPLSDLEREVYRDLIKKRGEFVPTAYLLKKKNFYGFDFYVDETVLIPRPETEELVEHGLKLLKSRKDSVGEIRILDLCCGSGCIGVTLALQLTNHRLSVDFVDISSEALKVCRRNWESLIHSDESKRTSKQARFLESDLFHHLPLPSPNLDKYDCILSNPPYVLPEEEETLSPEVRKEPRLALIVDDYMDFHSRILRDALPRLESHGFLLIETHPRMISDLLDRSKSLGYNSSILVDMSGKERFLIVEAS